jgi:ubiquinone/menaquinone biosynthesis C-methylase UbiE
VIVDVGSNWGKPVADAKDATGINAQILAIEPAEDAVIYYDNYLPSRQKEGVILAHAYGEDLPLPDNYAAGSQIHNVVFRTARLVSMLREITRVVKPGGLNALSTNAKGHAPGRHGYFSEVAVEAAKMVGMDVGVPGEPADGCYLEDIPEILKVAGGFEEVDEEALQARDPEIVFRQDSRIIITPGHVLDTFLEAILFSANRVFLPVAPYRSHAELLLAKEYRDACRQITFGRVKLEIERVIDKKGYYTDVAKRGQVVSIIR